LLCFCTEGFVTPPALFALTFNLFNFFCGTEVRTW
jgi:hypothetical protein